MQQWQSGETQAMAPQSIPSAPKRLPSMTSFTNMLPAPENLSKFSGWEETPGSVNEILPDKH